MREDADRASLAGSRRAPAGGMAWMVADGPKGATIEPKTDFRRRVLTTLAVYNGCVRTGARDPFGRDPLVMKPIGPSARILPVRPRLFWSYGGVEINDAPK